MALNSNHSKKKLSGEKMPKLEMGRDSLRLCKVMLGMDWKILPGVGTFKPLTRLLSNSVGRELLTAKDRLQYK